MPRRYNPRAIAREAKALRAEQMRHAMSDMRQTRRETRHVQSRLEAVQRYGVLRKAYLNVLVQDAIDDIEFRHLNHERIKSGITPYKSVEEMLNPPPIYTEKDFPTSPPPYRTSDYE